MGSNTDIPTCSAAMPLTRIRSRYLWEVGHTSQKYACCCCIRFPSLSSEGGALMLHMRTAVGSLTRSSHCTSVLHLMISRTASEIAVQVLIQTVLVLSLCAHS